MSPPLIAAESAATPVPPSCTGVPVIRRKPYLYKASMALPIPSFALSDSVVVDLLLLAVSPATRPNTSSSNDMVMPESAARTSFSVRLLHGIRLTSYLGSTGASGMEGRPSPDSYNRICSFNHVAG